MILVTDEIAVLTPEKVVVSYPVASLSSRVTAHLLDLVFAAMTIAGLVTFANLFLGWLSTDMAEWVASLIAAFGLFGYFMLFEGLWQGQTLGKRSLGLRVVMTDGTPVTGMAAFYRNLLRPADMFPSFYLVGFVCIFTNPLAQRLGDQVAGTIVVKSTKPVSSFSAAPHRYGTHPFEPHVPGLARMTMEEYFAIKRLCDRFPLLPAGTQASCLRTVWEPFASRHGVEALPGVHPIYLMEAVVMKYSRAHRLV